MLQMLCISTSFSDCHARDAAVIRPCFQFKLLKNSDSQLVNHSQFIHFSINHSGNFSLSRPICHFPDLLSMSKLHLRLNENRKFSELLLFFPRQLRNYMRSSSTLPFLNCHKIISVYHHFKFKYICFCQR